MKQNSKVASTSNMERVTIKLSSLAIQPDRSRKETLQANTNYFKCPAAFIVIQTCQTVHN